MPFLDRVDREPYKEVPVQVANMEQQGMAEEQGLKEQTEFLERVGRDRTSISC